MAIALLFPHWYVDFNNILYVGGFWQASDGSRSLSLTSGGAIGQTVTGSQGVMYQFAFDLAGDPTLYL